MAEWPSLYSDRLIGRDDDLTRLHDLLPQARLVTLTGPGGTGKTRLATALVAAITEAGRAAWFVDCGQIDDAAVIAVKIAATMDVDADGDPIGRLVDVLQGKDAVLALDNLEQIDKAGAVAVRLLEAVPGLVLIATSRVRLQVPGEVEFAVRPLALPTDASAEAVAASPAGRLFLARVSAMSSSQAIGDTAASDIAALLIRLDGLPLAIELAAARTRTMSPAEINRRLDAGGLDAIDGGGTDAHRSLNTILDWTIGRLGSDERETLEAVSVCATFDVALIESLIRDRDPIPGIETLIDLGLVHPAGSVAGTSRFGVLQTIQAFVQQRLTADRSEELRRRHAAHFVEVAAEWDRVAAATPPNDLVRRFDADADNIRRALDFLEVADPSAAARLLSRLGGFWSSHGRLVEGYERFNRARAQAGQPSIELVRAATGQLSSIWGILPPAESRALMDWTIDAARTVRDSAALAESLRQRAYLAFNEADLERLVAVAAELESISSELDRVGRLNLADIRSLTAAAIDGRTSDRHVILMRAYLDELGGAEFRVRHAMAEGNLAGSLLARGEHAEAIHRASHAAETFRELDRPDEVAWALAFLAPALAEAGRHAEAVETAIECATTSADMAYPENVASALWAAMPVALAVGRPELTARLWGALVPGMLARAEVVLNPMDTTLADGWLKRAQHAAPRISIELATRDGQESEPIALLRSLPVLLRTRTGRAAPAGVLRHGALTAREIEVFTLVGAGRSDREIGDALFISAKTVSVHVTHIKEKLQVDSRLQAALKARELGLVHQPVDS